jgi:cell division protein FtsB
MLGLDYKEVTMKKNFKKYKKQIVITVALVVLNIVFGFDARFTIINLIWLFV